MMQLINSLQVLVQISRHILSLFSFGTGAVQFVRLDIQKNQEAEFDDTFFDGLFMGSAGVVLWFRLLPFN